MILILPYPTSADVSCCCLSCKCWCLPPLLLLLQQHAARRHPQACHPAYLQSRSRPLVPSQSLESCWERVPCSAWRAARFSRVSSASRLAATDAISLTMARAARMYDVSTSHMLNTLGSNIEMNVARQRTVVGEHSRGRRVVGVAM